MGWPGFGGVPPDPSVRGIDDLVALVCARIDRPTALIAQSMGGVVAVRVALERPDLVTHLVLAVTSGGLDLSAYGAVDWRASFEVANPHLPRWFSLYQEDLSIRLPELAMPALLLWGDADPISPVGAGKHLADLIPRARLHVISGGDHDIVETHATEVAALVDAHLSCTGAD